MKKLLNWFVLAMLMVIALPMASCSDDDDEPNYPAVTTANIIGDWTTGDTYKTTEKAVVEYAGTINTFKSIGFHANGAFSATTDEGEVTGTYSLNGDALNITATGLTTTAYTVKFRGMDTKTLCISWNTTGVLGANEEEGIAGEKVNVTCTTHFALVETAE